MNNNLPQVIAFQEYERADNYKYKLPYQLNSGIEIMSIDYDLESLKQKGIKFHGSRAKIDSVFYLHPYKDNVYINSEIAEEYLLSEKIELYKSFAAVLGAREIYTEFIQREDKSIEVTFDGKVQVKVVNAGLNISNIENNMRSKLHQINHKIDIVDNFDLNKNIDKLYKKIEDYNLDHEIDLISLVKSRDSRDSGVQLKETTIKSEITSEYNNLLKISAQLSSPVFNLGADFNESLKTVNSLTINLKFKF